MVGVDRVGTLVIHPRHELAAVLTNLVIDRQLLSDEFVKKKSIS